MGLLRTTFLHTQTHGGAMKPRVITVTQQAPLQAISGGAAESPWTPCLSGSVATRRGAAAPRGCGTASGEQRMEPLRRARSPGRSPLFSQGRRETRRTHAQPYLPAGSARAAEDVLQLEADHERWVRDHFAQVDAAPQDQGLTRAPAPGWGRGCECPRQKGGGTGSGGLAVTLLRSSRPALPPPPAAARPPAEPGRSAGRCGRRRAAAAREPPLRCHPARRLPATGRFCSSGSEAARGGRASLPAPPTATKAPAETQRAGPTPPAADGC